MTPSQAPKDQTSSQDQSLDEFASILRKTGLIHRLLKLAYDEDLGPPDQDWTGEHMFTRGQSSSAQLTLREPGIVAGLAFVPDILEIFVHDDEPMTWTPSTKDGDDACSGSTLGTLTGSAIALVRLERTLLNLISRMSGIATRTNHFVKLAMGTKAQICDTRKTTPGLRFFEKYAVRCGRGTSHRMGLYDALLIKDNHLVGLDQDAFKARIQTVSQQARDQSLEFIEVEVDTLAQLRWALSLPPGVVDFVLLDNMPPETLTQAVSMRNKSNPSTQLEASGGIDESTFSAIAQTGVDRISIGGLTHHAVSIDIGLDTL